MNHRLFDAHNHLQDERLGTNVPSLMGACRSEGVCGMVVNGACEQDWPRVLQLSTEWPEVIPSFGYHPWYVRERSANWKETLLEYLDKCPSAVGEIGLDRWVKDPDFAGQEEAFVFQLRVASERNLPASIHCLKAWGWLYDLLKGGPRPACGFILHSFGGPAEMIPALVNLGAYFSFPGYYAHERKGRQRDAFKQVPIDRLLIETDAPDQSLPADCVRYPLPPGFDGKPVNHPANLVAVYKIAAELIGMPLPELSETVEQNFLRVFGRLMRSRPSSDATT